MSRPQPHKEPDPQLTRQDIELVLLQNQLDYTQRWLIFPDCLTDEARDFLDDLSNWLKRALLVKREAV